MYSLIRPALFSLDAETAHKYALKALDLLPSCYFKKPKIKQSIAAMGMTFQHPVGLAAGLDKNGEHLEALSKLGFSFIELGTITPRPQLGNPKPRLFRLPQAHALINRMGFNNLGVDVLVENVNKANFSGILGINIGKNKDTSLNHAADDYLHCLKKVYAKASYVTINISSPNTPDLRQLQQIDYLDNLLEKLVEEQKHLADSQQRHVPLLIKLSPDEDDESLKRMADVILKHAIAGIIATNTTCSRIGVNQLPYGDESGGLSGQPLFERSTACLRILNAVVGKTVCLIGVGGIDDVATAEQKLQAGATLLQIYSGLIYHGPQWVTALADGLKVRS
jgi:dihydroorotate dehydrogenase